MLENALFQILLYLILLCLLAAPLGWYMARVYEKRPCGLDYLLGPFERLIYRICLIHPEKSMGWKRYLTNVLFFNLLGVLFLYFLQRLQVYLPLNPQVFANVPPALAFNTAISFITNTNWQAYGGENSLSYLVQMLGLTVQNFLSAATGMAILMAFIRGLKDQEKKTGLGNFWVDLIRGTLYILLPLAIVFSLFLVSQGTIQNLKPYETATLISPIQMQTKTINQQIIPMGPVASQIAIKQLGTNGGGFFNTNSAHPFENPTPLTNFFEMLAIVLVPAALCFTFGILVKDKRQGLALFIAMFIIFIPYALIATYCEAHNFSLNQTQFTGGNMEGKEVRFGIVNSTLWATATTATSNGSVNSMLSSFNPLGGMVPLCLMHLGEVVFGGAGSGLYNMVMLIILTVFISGLMVGRTPEYLGKKIGPFEIKMASFAVLLMPMSALLLTAFSVVTHFGTDSIQNPGPHGLTEILYAFTSMGSNNGSSFAGLNSNTPFFNIAGGIEMLSLHFWLAIPALAIAGSMSQKKKVPANLGTLPTHTPFFIFLLIGITIILGMLTFFPALALGPIVEHIMLWN